MPHKVFSVPNFRNTSTDLLFCNPDDPTARGLFHYAYAVNADKDALLRRMLHWTKTREFTGAYAKQHPDVIARLTARDGYTPGEGVLGRTEGSTDDSDHNTIMRLGALEMLGNISSGRLSTNDKDPFPHQLALQQFMRKPLERTGPRRILIADEVGLGKTIEVGLILRDILLARGRLEDFRCLYLTSGGLVEDAAEKLRHVLKGSVDGQSVVATVSSFRRYGTENTSGVHVASMHAARLYASEKRKKTLPKGTRPHIVIIDECHHAASEGELAGATLKSSLATQTYIVAKQLLSGEFWPESEAPELAILMSATPFRSKSQFVNLLRLLTDGTEREGGGKFRAFDAGVQAAHLQAVLRDPDGPASVVWRRQSDPGVKSWSGGRIFPNLTIVRPHQAAEDDPRTPKLNRPNGRFLTLLANVKQTVSRIARAHGTSFGGFATAQLEKKLTSSSIAGACTLFTWAVRHSYWATQELFQKDKRPATEGLRRLLKLISQRIAAGDPQNKAIHADVFFPSDSFKFEATSISKDGASTGIYKFSDKLRDGYDDEDGDWVGSEFEIVELVGLAEKLLGIGTDGDAVEGAQDTKLDWLRKLLARYPDERFIVFTESLQTCETLKNVLGKVCLGLDGTMGQAERNKAVEALRDPKGSARVLVATSAADEGIDLQIASRVVHWDLSPSPATLMQRNGRAARLGQVRDVVAYYLILGGTHEEQRDTGLQAKFAELGIDDEALKSRILGSLTEEEETRLDEGLAENNEGVVGEILDGAKRGNELMDRELAALSADLQPAQALSRDDLAQRLRNWKQIGLTDAAAGGASFQFKDITWDRPVFGEVARMESITSASASLQVEKQKQEVVFDPEFLVFGPKDSKGIKPPKLAGLSPWVNKTDLHGKHVVVPFELDLLGRLFRKVARLSAADFLTIPKSRLNGKLPAESRWLLFCTHPLREAENVLATKPRPYLTYYSFSELDESSDLAPIDPEGADADEVHNFIDAAERYAIEANCTGLANNSDKETAARAGKMLRVWVASVTKFGASSFLEAEKYFVPMPVALVRVV